MIGNTNWGNHKLPAWPAGDRCEPGVQTNVRKLPPKTDKARTRVLAFAIFLPPSKIFTKLQRRVWTCHCTRDLGSEEIGCKKKLVVWGYGKNLVWQKKLVVRKVENRRLKRFPELYLYVIVQVFARFGKISGRVWSSHGLYFGETVGRAKIPMARPNKPWYFPESSKNLHDYMFIITDQKYIFEISRL